MRIVLEENVEYNKEISITSPSSLLPQLTELRNLDQEAMAVILLDTKNHIIEINIVTLGIVNASLAHPREIFRQAIKQNATSIIIAHNHPSGNTTPSQNDCIITERFINAGKIIDIKVLDHIIVSNNSNFYSFRDSKSHLFN